MTSFFDADLESALEDLDSLNDTYIMLDSIIKSGKVGVEDFSSIRGRNILTSTAMESLALGIVSGNDSENLSIAVEGIVDNIKETAAKWAAKIVTVVKNAISKVTDILDPVVKKIQDKAKNFSVAAVDAAKLAKQKMKAHPYKTIAAGIGAAVLVAGVIVFVTRGFPAFGSPISAFRVFNAKLLSMIEKINSPFMKVTASLDGKTGGLASKVLPLEPMEMALTAAEIGVTASSVGSLMRDTKSSLDKTSRAWSDFSRHSASITDKVGSTLLSHVGKEDFGKVKELEDKIVDKAHAAIDSAPFKMFLRTLSSTCYLLWQLIKYGCIAAYKSFLFMLEQFEEFAWSRDDRGISGKLIK